VLPDGNLDANVDRLIPSRDPVAPELGAAAEDPAAAARDLDGEDEVGPGAAEVVVETQLEEDERETGQ
jgi:hypothetical protein